MKCEDCKDTGLIMTQSIKLGRPYFDKEKGIICDVEYGDDWQETQCHCVGED